MKTSRITLPAAMLIAGGIGYFSDALPTLRAVAQPPRSASCDIKGNISINTGEHIYHVRGQKYYAATRISPQYGERWFCSEADARAAGWRKARE